MRSRRWTRAAGVLFVVNDRPDIARLADADGVHLGQDDLPVAAARRVVGPDALIGVSTHTADQVRRAVLDGADYLGVGPTFPSRTKSFEQFPGLAFVTEVAELTSLPAFALGGVQADNLPEVVAAGGRGWRSVRPSPRPTTPGRLRPACDNCWMADWRMLARCAEENEVRN